MLFNPQWEVNEALRRAAQIIRVQGWCQNRWRDDQGHVCVRIAINEAAQGSNELFVAVGARLSAYLGLPSIDSYVNWNDSLDRTQQQVIDALEAAAQ